MSRYEEMEFVLERPRDWDRPTKVTVHERERARVMSEVDMCDVMARLGDDRHLSADFSRIWPRPALSVVESARSHRGKLIVRADQRCSLR